MQLGADTGNNVLKCVIRCPNGACLAHLHPFDTLLSEIQGWCARMFTKTASVLEPEGIKVIQHAH